MQAVLDEARQLAQRRQAMANAETAQQPAALIPPTEPAIEPVKPARRWSAEERQRMQVVLDEARELARKREAAAKEEAQRKKLLEQAIAAAAPAPVERPKRVWSEDERERIQAALDKVRAVRVSLETKTAAAAAPPVAGPDPFGKAPWTDEFRDELLSAVAQLRQDRSAPPTATSAHDVHQPRVTAAPLANPGKGAALSGVGRKPPTQIDEAPDEPVGVQVQAVATLREFALPEPPKPVPPRWYGLGEFVVVGTYKLLGLVSVASGTSPGQTLHMSTIDASLEVRKGRGGGDIVRPDGSIEVKPYRDLLPASREAYLKWLAAGCVQSAPAHLVLLYLAGLEARILDVGPGELGKTERDDILKSLGSLCRFDLSPAPEVKRFQSKLLQLLAVAAIPTAVYRRRPEQLDLSCSQAFLAKAALGQAAHDDVALPPVWAMQWVRVEPSKLHSSDEFLGVFAKRYEQVYPRGIPVKKGDEPVRFKYSASPYYAGEAAPVASAQVVDSVDAHLDEGDLVSLDAMYKRTKGELAVYERYVTTNPNTRGTADAEVRLPLDYLLTKFEEPLHGLRHIKPLSADDLAVALWGATISSASSQPFLNALLAARPLSDQTTPKPKVDTANKLVEAAVQSTDEPESKRLVLDMNKVAAIQAATAEFSPVLGAIFSGEVEEGGSASTTVEAAPAQADTYHFGLDAEHTELLLTVLERERWSRSDLEALVSGRHLMFDGALEQLNEAALDATDEVLLEDEGDFAVNLAAAKAMREILDAPIR